MFFCKLQNRYTRIIFLIITTLIYIVSILIGYPKIQQMLHFQYTIGEISDKFHTLITPINFTFSIWGLIYCLGLILLGYWWWNLKNENFESQNTSIIFFDVIALLNSFWIFSWLKEGIFLSWLIILVLLIALLYINTNIQNSKMYLNKIFFNIYLGWISVAFSINTAVWLTTMGMPRDTYMAVIMASILVLIITLIACYILLVKNNLMYILVILWSFLGIIMNNFTNEGIKFQRIVIGMSIILIFCILYYFIKRSNNKQE